MTRLVLSIDGGGLLGLIPALVLADIERRTGKRCADIFDLIAGTSTGGIIACGLVARVPAADLVALYRDHGAEIFARDIGQEFGSLDGLSKPKYSAGALEAKLKAVLGDKLLSDASTHLQVPAVLCGEAADMHWFTSWSGPNFFLRQVARATSAAPYYFPPVVISSVDGDAMTFADGGLFANNPEVDAALSAMALWPDEEIAVLSLGCGFESLSVPAKPDWGAMDWLSSLVELVMTLSVRAAVERAQIMGHPSVRLDAACGGAMDDASAAQIAKLIAAAKSITTGDRMTAAFNLIGDKAPLLFA